MKDLLVGGPRGVLLAPDLQRRSRNGCLSLVDKNVQISKPVLDFLKFDYNRWARALAGFFVEQIALFETGALVY